LRFSNSNPRFDDWRAAVAAVKLVFPEYREKHEGRCNSHSTGFYVRPDRRKAAKTNRAPGKRAASVDREVFGLLPYYRNLIVTVLEQVLVPASHTIYVKLDRPVTPVEL